MPWYTEACCDFNESPILFGNFFQWPGVERQGKHDSKDQVSNQGLNKRCKPVSCSWQNKSSPISFFHSLDFATMDWWGKILASKIVRESISAAWTEVLQALVRGETSQDRVVSQFLTGRANSFVNSSPVGTSSCINPAISAINVSYAKTTSLY